MNGLGNWSWRLFMQWIGLVVDDQALSKGEHLRIVAIAVPAIFRARCIVPARDRLLSILPRWTARLRLEPVGHGWHRIPDWSCAHHVRLRFDVFPISEGDLIQLKRGRPTAVAYPGEFSSEMIFLLTNGEIEPDPRTPFVAKAWASYWKALGEEG